MAGSPPLWHLPKGNRIVVCRRSATRESLPGWVRADLTGLFADSRTARLVLLSSLSGRRRRPSVALGIRARPERQSDLRAQACRVDRRELGSSFVGKINTAACHVEDAEVRDSYHAERTTVGSSCRIGESSHEVEEQVDRAADVQPGWLLFGRQGARVARRFDPRRGELSGDPAVVADSVAFSTTITGLGAFSVSTTGVIAYRTGGADRRQLTWFDRAGRTLGRLGPADQSLVGPMLSPDGRLAAVERGGSGVGLRP